MKGIEEYNFDPDTAEGKKVIEDIMNYVPLKTIKEAQFYISNLEQIQKTSIAIWPFWQQKIPGLKSGINIKIN